MDPKFQDRRIFGDRQPFYRILTVPPALLDGCKGRGNAKIGSNLPRGAERLNGPDNGDKAKATADRIPSVPNLPRLLLELVVAVATTEFGIMLALPRLAPGISDLAGSLVDTFCLCLIVTPLVVWRSRSGSRHGGPPSMSPRARLGLPIAMLCLGTIATVASVGLERKSLHEASRLRFQLLADRVEGEIRRRFDLPLHGLQGIDGLVANHPHMDRTTLRKFVGRLDLPHQFPGVRGFGYVESVPTARISDFEREVLAEDGEQVKVHPTNPDSVAYIIREVEPRSANAKALGFDMATDPIRKRAFERAAASGKPVLAGPIALFHDQKARPAYLLMAPLFRGDSLGRLHPASVAYGAYVLDELMAGIDSIAESKVDLEIFDSSDADTSRRIFDLDSRNESATSHTDMGVRKELEIGGRTLVVRIFPVRSFLAPDSAYLPWFIGAGGMALTLLLAVVAWIVSTGRERAESLVRHRTAELEETKFVLEKALRRSRNLLDSIHRHAIITLSDPTGRILDANERFCEVSGRTKEELVGRNHKIVGSGVHGPEFWAAMWQEISQGRPWIGEVCNRRPDGSIFWLDTLVIPFLDSKGKVESYQTIRFDITDRKRKEEELREAKRQAEAASVAKSAFLANMSHEIRTPMNGVLGMTSILLSRTLEPGQRETAEIIRSSAESLLTILNDILDFSKIEAGKLEIESIPFDLRNLLEEVSAVMAFRASEKSILLESHLSSGTPCLLRGDPGRLRQILVNLCGNAIKFTSEGSVAMGAVAVECRPEVARIRFTIRDTGIGIARRKVGDLFQPFSQVDASTTRRYGGTGLGLAICRQLVDLMGGTIGVLSEEGKGSEFWFELEFAREGEGDSVHPDALFENAEPRGFRGRILVAEDNAVNQLVARALLENMGLEVTMAENGQEAIQHLMHESFDLVLMDMQMPVMNGIDAARAWIHGAGGASSNLIPIVALTANAMKEDREACREAGMVDFLSKPFADGEMRALLGKWLPSA